MLVFVGQLSSPRFCASLFTLWGTWQELWQPLPCNIDFIRATRQENRPILIAPKENILMSFLENLMFAFELPSYCRNSFSVNAPSLRASAGFCDIL